jgi:hypothetical protein
MSANSLPISRPHVYATLLLAALNASACAEAPKAEGASVDPQPSMSTQLLAASNSATSKKLSVARFSQQPYGNLCWATCSAMVAAYFNSDSVDRTVDIAQEYAASTEPAKFNVRLPSQDIATSGQLVTRYSSDVSFWYRQSYMTNGTPQTTEFVTQQLPYEVIKTYIDQGDPLIASLPGSISLPGGMHDVVVVGYDERDGAKYVVFNDPWDGNEYEMAFDRFTTTSYVAFYRGAVAPEVPNTSFATAKLLEPSGNPVEIAGYIDPGQELYYYFVTPAYATYTIQTTGLTDTVGTLLADDRKTIVATNDDSNNTFNFSIEWTSGGMRTYYVKVRHFRPNRVGDFGISVRMK